MPEFRHFWVGGWGGESLAGRRSFHRANFTGFSCFRLGAGVGGGGGGAFSGRHFRVFVAESGTYIRQLLEGACPSIPTSKGAREYFWEIRTVPKVPEFSPFRAKS